MENGYHDNPTLDVTNDGQPEMREKKPSTNGLTGGGVGGGVRGGEDSSRWQVIGRRSQCSRADQRRESST